ncbi:MAG TPA: hypothetical protein VFC06_06790 [Demequina sp.]|nr:hypothetical protein [Demequina sp.]
MNVLETAARDRVGSMTALARQTGISERLLAAIGAGEVEPGTAHVRRIRQVLGQDLHVDAFPHCAPKVDSLMNVSETKVLAVRDEHLVRPASVIKDDMIRLVSVRDDGREKVEGWVKAIEDARWIRGDLVAFALKDGFVVECHPSQTVTVARRRPPAEVA